MPLASVLPVWPRPSLILFPESSLDAPGGQGRASVPKSVHFWSSEEILSLSGAFRPQQAQSWVSQGQTLNHGHRLMAKVHQEPRRLVPPLPQFSLLSHAVRIPAWWRGVGVMMRRRAWVPSQGPLGTGGVKGLGVLQDGQRRRGS